MVQGSEQRESVVALGKTREQFAEVHAGHGRSDRLEGPAILKRSIRLHIECVEVARSTPKPEHDHCARAREDVSFNAVAREFMAPGREAERGQCSGPQELTSGLVAAGSIGVVL